jgi:alkylated DNA repair dioxygenase AlkB
MQQLIEEISWRQDEIVLFGRPILQPRLVCWMADPGIALRYSGLTIEATSWAEPLTYIKHLIETKTGYRFNGVLLNYYRHGTDSMGWHADDEPELGPDPVIASISLGAERKFQLKPKSGPSAVQTILLEHGSLLLMGTGSQRYYKHQVPKVSRPIGPRINLTFRLMQKTT